MLKIPYCCSPCQSFVNYRNNNITQHALKVKLVKVSVFIMFKLDNILYPKEEGRRYSVSWLKLYEKHTYKKNKN